MGYSAAPSSLLVSHSQFTDVRPRATLAVGPTAAGYNALPPPPPFVTRTSGSPVVFSRTTHTPRTRPPINCAPRSPSPRPPPFSFFPSKPPLRLPLTSIAAAARPDCVVRGVTPLFSISSPVVLFRTGSVRALGPHPYRRVARPSPSLRVTSFRRGSRCGSRHVSRSGRSHRGSRRGSRRGSCRGSPRRRAGRRPTRTASGNASFGF